MLRNNFTMFSKYEKKCMKDSIERAWAAWFLWAVLAVASKTFMAKPWFSEPG